MKRIVPADAQLVDDVASVIAQRIQERPLQDRGRGAEPLAEGDVLVSTARQYGHESAAPRRDVTKILAAGQLAVGHVKEVGMADQLVEQVPVPDVGTVVDRV